MMSDYETIHGQYRESINLTMEAIRICGLTQNHDLLAQCYENQSRLFRKLGQLGKAFHTLHAALQIYEVRSQNVRKKAMCLVKMSAILKQAENVRSQFPEEARARICGYYMEEMGVYYGPADMPRLWVDSVSLGDGYLVGSGRKFSHVQEFIEQFTRTDEHSNPLNPAVSMEDPFPDENLSSQEFAKMAFQLAGESNDLELLREMEEILTSLSLPDEAPDEFD